MQEEKKQLEVLLINYFQECYTDFPKGKLVESESPDFVVKLKNKYTLGIELTRLNPANAIPPTADGENEIIFRNGFIEELKEFFESRSDFKLFVKFLFSTKDRVTPERELSVKVRIANLIQTKLKNRKTNSFFSIQVTPDELPAGVEQLLIVHHPGLEDSVWERSNNLGLSGNVVDDIKKAIGKKDEKLQLYRKQHLNNYWLLITTDCLRGVKNYNVLNKVMNEDFYSHFQHVFLFDLVKARVHKLV